MTDSASVVLDVPELSPILPYVVLSFCLISVADELPVMTGDKDVLVVAGVEGERVVDNSTEKLVQLADARVEGNAVGGGSLWEVESYGGGGAILSPAGLDVRAEEADVRVLLVRVRVTLDGGGAVLVRVRRLQAAGAVGTVLARH